MSGFWSSETLENRLPELITPYNSEQIVSCAYELSMGDKACVTSWSETPRRDGVKLGPSERVTIPPGQFAQLLTYEYVRIPADAIGLISMKYGIKRRGLINVSGFHVDPGYEGKLVFAVFNAGSTAIIIGQKELTFLLWYVSLDCRTTNVYSGSRLGVEDITPEDQMNLRGPTYNPTALATRVSRLEDHNKVWRLVAITLAGVFFTAIVGEITGVVDLSAIAGK